MCDIAKESIIINPFNYHGAKHKLIPQLKPLIPDNISTFVDVFGGSGEMSLNIVADKVIYNDKNEPFVNMLRNFDDSFISEVDAVIARFNLNKTNLEGYLACRDYYNSNIKTLGDRERAVVLYSLLCHSFNNQVSFNRKKEFNLPFGKDRSEFNESLREKLEIYIKRLKEVDIEFLSVPFVKLAQSTFPDNSFVYADPPYLITTGPYERDYRCKWTVSHEFELYSFLDKLNRQGIKFGMSNVLKHKGKTNDLLIDWAKDYNTHYLDMTYRNCNYQSYAMNDDKESQEVFITNY